MTKYYSYSLLNKRCHRAIYLYGTTPEALPPPARAVGIGLHRAFKDRNWYKVKEMGFEYNYIKEVIERTLPQNVWQEKRFEIELGMGVGIRGKIDLAWVEGEKFNVCDIKSAYKYDSRVKKQLEVYSLHFSIDPTYNQSTCNLYVYLARSGEAYLVGTTKDEDRDRILGEVMERIWEVQEIQDRRETPKGEGSDECVWCDYSISCVICPLIPIAVRENPLEIAKDYLQAKAVVGHLEQILKVYCKEGCIELGDGSGSILGYHNGRFGISRRNI